ncbi:MAG TPA: hypothetical protein VGL82_10545 [Bryobacteraceae bacterium]
MPLALPTLGDAALSAMGQAMKAIVADAVEAAATPLLVLGYLISPNSGKVAIDSTDQLPAKESRSTPFTGTPKSGDRRDVPRFFGNG